MHWLCLGAVELIFTQNTVKILDTGTGFGAEHPLPGTGLGKEWSDAYHHQNSLESAIKSKCTDTSGLCQCKTLQSNTGKEESPPSLHSDF